MRRIRGLKENLPYKKDGWPEVRSNPVTTDTKLLLITNYYLLKRFSLYLCQIVWCNSKYWYLTADEAQGCINAFM